MMQIILTYMLPIFILMDIFFLSIAGGVTIQVFRWKQTIKISVIFAFVFGIWAYIALAISSLITTQIFDFKNITGSLLLAFVGIRMIIDAKKIKNQERTFLVEDQKILWSLALASSFHIFFAFLGLGFLGLNTNTPVFVLIISTLIISQMGLFFGSHYKPAKLGRSSKMAGGLFILVIILLNFIL